MSRASVNVKPRDRSRLLKSCSRFLPLPFSIVCFHARFSLKQMTSKLQQLFDEYSHEREASSRRRPETLRGYRAVFSTFMKLMPDAEPSSLTPKLMADFFHLLQTRERIIGRGTPKVGVKDSTIATYRTKLGAFFQWLVLRGHIANSPLAGIPGIKLSYNDVRSLRRSEIDKIRAAIENHPQNLLHLKRDRAMLYVLVCCGLRKRELISLKVTDVDLDRKVLVVRGETSKSRTTRLIPLNGQVRMALEDYLRERNRTYRYTTPSLFVGIIDDNGLTEAGLKYWVERLRKVSGVRFHLHQFRHTFAHNLSANGSSAIQLQKLLGHSDLRMTQLYVRSLSAEDLRPAVNDLDIDYFV
jgi:site-specific recombinase XerD